jgi:integral membrane protein (TIGR01906 family)
MAMLRSVAGALGALVTGLAVLLVLIALAIVPFLNPVWVGFGQERAQAEAWTGYTQEQLATVTGGILADLVLGPPDFDVTLDGAPVLNERERGHMRDVRDVFATFFLVAAGAFGVLVVLRLAARTSEARTRFWRRLRGSGLVIAVGTVVAGGLGVLFFDTAFEIFHQAFFPAGSYLFDPRTERLVQLFPQQFWVESTIGVGIVLIGLALGLAWLAGRRARAASA